MGVGAELETLQELHRTLTSNSEAAETIKTEVSNGVAQAVWDGTNANDFRDAWEDYKVNLDTLRDALSGAADDVRTSHNNQAEVSGEPDRI